MKAAKFVTFLIVPFVMAAMMPLAARAQGGPVDIQMFKPAMDSKGHFTVESSQVLGHLKPSIGLIVTGAWNPLVLKGNDREFVVDQMNTGYLQFAIGFLRKFEIGIGIPVHIVIGHTTPRDTLDDGSADPQGRWNQGTNQTKIEKTPLGYDDQGNFGSQGIGDAYIHSKWRILAASKNPVGLALAMSVSLPTGPTGLDSGFIGSDSITFAPRVIVDKLFGKRGQFLVSGNLGARVRTGNGGEIHENDGWLTCIRWEDRPDKSVPCSFDGYVDNNGTQNVYWKNDVFYSLGMTYRVSDKMAFVGELYGAVELTAMSQDDEQRTNPVDGSYTVTTKKEVMPMEALGGVKIYLGLNSYMALGGGVGITGLVGDHVGAPDFRLFGSFVFEPLIGDKDGDGYPDDVDQCPNEPEDFDNFQDRDGCPDPDNDRDGILDQFDKCPNEPEDKDGYQDDDGCPEDNVSDRDGDGIPDDRDKCPDTPEDKDEFEDMDGCPEADNDADGIPDTKDICPGMDEDKKNGFAKTKEDKDGFQDEDGCPDPDNDQDRILDKDDQCPNEPETYNGYQDEDGCPDKGKVRVTAGKIEIFEKVYFETNKAIIKPESYPILDAVAATLKGHPEIKLVEIQGHTDERNSDEYNMRLSQDRAEAVRQYLMDKGVEPARLIARGYGESRPIDPRHNAEAWAKNRRVEFVILKRSSGDESSGSSSGSGGDILP